MPQNLTTNKSFSFAIRLTLLAQICLQARWQKTVSPHMASELTTILFGRSFKVGFICEPPHDKTNKMTVTIVDSDQPGHPPSLISLHCPHEETLGSKLSNKRKAKTDQTGQMPRLIRIFAGCTCHLLIYVVQLIFQIFLPMILKAQNL